MSRYLGKNRYTLFGISLYRISNVSTTMMTATVNQATTLYSVMFGLKYSFWPN
ncbi:MULTISPECIES: hypothetical protein [Asticcacaulis]|uniref:hypothetical protein n=1 Tax=Asticcacaulis TaxID=76890 RepID=UPI001AE39508|nr:MULTISPECIES: hypothetical protein [Asticcacaulis]MBP2159318.1 hypothetical protein [Asticcacaulis solisilvae]MDR6800363.1 hypothetical protein [Asticcacaulis sp. BE141]